MKIQTLLIASAMLLAAACRKEPGASFQHDWAAARQGDWQAFQSLLMQPSEGTLRLAHYSYAPERGKYQVNGHFEPGMAIGQAVLNGISLDLAERSSFYHDSGLQAAGLQAPGPLPDFFGAPLGFKLLSGGEAVLEEVVDIPAKLEMNMGASPDNPTPDLYLGYALQWNAAPENELGLYLRFEFDPAGNTHLPEPAFREEKYAWHLHLPETGAYTLKADDFPPALPEGAVLFVRAIRATVKNYPVATGNFRLIAQSEGHGLVRYRAE